MTPVVVVEVAVAVVMFGNIDDTVAFDNSDGLAGFVK